MAETTEVQKQNGDAPKCPRCGELATFEAQSFREGHRAFWCSNAHSWYVPATPSPDSRHA